MLHQVHWYVYTSFPSTIRAAPEQRASRWLVIDVKPPDHYGAVYRGIVYLMHQQWVRISLLRMNLEMSNIYSC